MPAPVVLKPHAVAAGLIVLDLSAAAIGQTTDTPTLETCATIGAPSDRLACYDRLAGRAAAPAVPPAQESLPIAATPPSTSLLAPTGAKLPETAAPQAQTTLMSKFWELEPADKRGIFNFVGFRPNYVLPIHITSRINRTPQSPTQATVTQPDYRREEAKFQLSLRTKLAQDILLPEADLWVAFSQQVMWQVWNGKDSKPFRNTDFEPEAIYVVPTPKSWRELPLGWQWRYTQFGLAHRAC